MFSSTHPILLPGSSHCLRRMAEPFLIWFLSSYHFPTSQDLATDVGNTDASSPAANPLSWADPSCSSRFPCPLSLTAHKSEVDPTPGPAPESSCPVPAPQALCQLRQRRHLPHGSRECRGDMGTEGTQLGPLFHLLPNVKKEASCPNSSGHIWGKRKDGGNYTLVLVSYS